MSLFPLRPLQQTALDAVKSSVRAGKKRIVVQAPTGFGKCLGRGTPVMLFDGSVIPVEDVSAGDRLMGPDSRPRTVLSTCRGREMLYQVTPIKGEPYVVNESHILSLKICAGVSKEKNPGRDGGLFPGKVVNIEVREYLRSSKTFRHIAKGWRPDGVDFFPTRAELKIEPYFLGLWLGDGFSYRPAICTGDDEISDAVFEYASANGLMVRREANSENSVNLHLYAGARGGDPSTRPDNALRHGLSFYGLFNNKHIPASYKTASRSDRLKLLAGMIDSDGHLVSAGGFEVVFQSERLMDDFLFVARSLGFSGYKKAVRKTCANNGVAGSYFRCTLYGHLETIPTRVPRKRSPPRRQIKNHLIVGIESVEPVGAGDYFGFEIDGDRLFLLGDFTVTHNTILGAHMAAGALAKNNRAAFVVPMLTLIDQTFERFVSNGISAGDMGVMQANHPWRRAHAPLQICSVQTIAKRGFPEVKFVIVDEAHMRFEAIDRWMKECPDVLFFGLSATPWSKGMGEVWDDLIIPTTLAELIAVGDLCRFRVFAAAKPDLSKVRTVAGEYHEGELSSVMSGKEIVADVVSTWLEKSEGRPTLLFAVDRAHAGALHDQFREAGVQSAYVDGETPREERQTILERYAAGEFKIICSVGTMTTGVDVTCRCIVDAAPTKSEIRHVQKIGRGLRNEPGKESCLVFDHAGNSLRLGLPTEIGRTTLRTGKSDEKETAERKEKAEPLPKECGVCGCLMPAKVRICDACGAEFKRTSDVRTVDGELIEMGGDGSAKKSTPVILKLQKQGKQAIFSQLCAVQGSKSDGWRSHKFKAIFGVWPRGLDAFPAEPTRELSSWLHAERIKWAKSKAAKDRRETATPDEGKALADAA